MSCTEGLVEARDASRSAPPAFDASARQRSTRQILAAHAADAIQNEDDRKKFATEMRQFETRMKTVNPSRTADLFNQVDRLFTTPDKQCIVPRTLRIELAEQVMRHAAYPTRID